MRRGTSRSLLGPPLSARAIARSRRGRLATASSSTCGLTVREVLRLRGVAALHQRHGALLDRVAAGSGLAGLGLVEGQVVIADADTQEGAYYAVYGLRPGGSARCAGRGLRLLQCKKSVGKIRYPLEGGIA